MNSGMAVLLALGIGVVARLRSLTAPAVVAWAAYLGWLHLHGSPLAFMGSVWAVGIFTLLALVEFVTDQLPTTPARTAAVPLGARIVMGALTGACLGVAGGAALWLGALLGTIGGIAGAFGGYQARVRPGPRASCSGCCGRCPGRPGRDRSRTADRFSILKAAVWAGEPQWCP